jgi:hypothetical protein
MIASAGPVAINPLAAKDDTRSEVAVLLWRRLVTPTPTRKDLNLLETLTDIT